MPFTHMKKADWNVRLVLKKLFWPEQPSDPQLDTKVYKARRAFQIRQFEDEGPHYVLELEDGSVLSLVGQYLYEYEPVENGKASRPRSFPCTEFALKRERNNGLIVGIDCRGDAFEPECIAPPYTEKELDSDDLLTDDLIITARTYDEIKNERMRTHQNS